MCTRPIPAYQPHDGATPRLWPPLGTANLNLGCGNCDECRARKSAEWGMRGAHEASLYEDNIFVALTYNDEQLPPDGQLVKPDAQRFIQRTRDRRRRHPNDIEGDHSQPIRYMTCGEYGEQSGRPHYHFMLFNCGFPDGKRVAHNNGNELYESDILTSLWSDKDGSPLGIANYGIATPGKAAAYIAKYTSKGWNKGTRCNADGVELPPQFMHMSTKPPIGHAWLAQYKDDLKHGYIVDDTGTKRNIPRAYLKMLTKREPEYVQEILARRDAEQRRTTPNDYSDNRNHPDRQAARDIINRQKRDAHERKRSFR